MRRNIYLSKAAVGDVMIVPLVQTVLAEFSYPDRNLYTTTRVIRNNSHKLPPCVIHLFQQMKLKERVNTLFGIDFPSHMSIESSIICCQLRRDRTWVHCWACGNSPLSHGICDSCALHVIYQAPISVCVSSNLCYAIHRYCHRHFRYSTPLPLRYPCRVTPSHSCVSVYFLFVS